MKDFFEKLVPKVSAHCDVPCGIYDPITAQIAALSVVRMVDLMHALEGHDALTTANSMSRYIATKESEAIKCKEEIRIIWGDFIKPAHLEQFPQIHDVVHKIMMSASAAKQGVSREKAMELLEAVNSFAEIFWAIKGLATKRVKAPYAPNEEVVYPVL